MKTIELSEDQQRTLDNILRYCWELEGGHYCGACFSCDAADLGVALCGWETPAGKRERLAEEISELQERLREKKEELGG